MINEFQPGVDAISSECDIKPNPSLNLLDLVGTKCGDFSTKDSVERERPVTNMLPDSRMNGANNYMPDREFLEFTNPFVDRSLSSNLYVQESRRELLSRYASADNRPESLMQHLREIESPTRVPALRPDQIERVYQSVSSLFGPEAEHSPLKLRERSLLARTILENVARPDHVHQGSYGTCQVATIEEQAYTLIPERAAEAVARIGLSGTFITGDNRLQQFLPDHLHPFRDAQRGFDSEERVDGDRSFASQLLQIALVNDCEQRRVPPRHYRIVDHGTRFREVLETEDGLIANGGTMTSPDIVDTARRFGLNNFSIVGHSFTTERSRSDSIFNVSSEDDLRRLLSQAQLGRMPLAVRVNVLNSPELFGTRTDITNGTHLLTIRSFDPGRNTVNLSNQWSQQYDRNDVPLRELYRAMAPR